MKAGRIILVIVLFVIVGGAAYYFGIRFGANLVRNGLIANYPTVRNLIQGATAEFDSSISVTLAKENNEELFAALKGDSKNDSLEITIPYHGRFGIDLTTRNFRVFRDEETVETWLPPVRLLYCELRFDRMLVNGKKSELMKNENFTELRTKMHDYLQPKIEKDKKHQQDAKTVIAKAVMFYFMPYKYDLKLYIDDQPQTLPVVPGVNKNVDEYIKEMAGKPEGK